MRTPFADDSSMNLPPPDEAARQERVFMAEIGKLNEQIGHYILRYLDADAGRAEPLSVTEERALADILTALGSKVRMRADRRVSTPPAAIEGTAALRQLPSGRSSDPIPRVVG